MNTQNSAMKTKSPSRLSDFLWTIIRFREAGIGIFILILVVAVTLREPSFLTLDNLEDIILSISILAMMI